MPVPALTPPRKYHVAISFAGEDRQYVEEVHKLLKANGLEVFYSNAEQTEMFAEHLPTKLEEIYQRQSHYCLVFVSQSYTNKIWPLKEYRSALKKAVEQKQPYILPARFDDSDLDGLGPEIVFADLRRNMTPAQLASLVLSKLSQSPASPDAPVAAPEPPSTPLIGRGAELSDIQRLLGQEDVRLLVLHGEGGTGKTRLAVEVVKAVEEGLPAPSPSKGSTTPLPSPRRSPALWEWEPGKPKGSRSRTA
jgi:TIR domain